MREIGTKYVIRSHHEAVLIQKLVGPTIVSMNTYLLVSIKMLNRAITRLKIICPTKILKTILSISVINLDFLALNLALFLMTLVSEPT